MHGTDHRADIWSLGVVLYEMLSGLHPFVAPSYQALLPRIAEQPHAPLDSALPPAAARAVVDRCLAKRPEDRYATAAEVADAIELALPGSGEPSDLSLEPTRAVRPPSADGATPIRPAGAPARASGRRRIGLAGSGARRVALGPAGTRSPNPSPSPPRR